MLLAYTFPTNALLTETQLELLENLIFNKTLKDQNVPGLAISVVQGDGFNEIFSKGYGFSDVENEIPATNQTLFGIGSLSKVIQKFCANFVPCV